VQKVSRIQRKHVDSSYTPRFPQAHHGAALIIAVEFSHALPAGDVIDYLSLESRPWRIAPLARRLERFDVQGGVHMAG